MYTVQGIGLCAPLHTEDTATSPEHLVLLFWGGSRSAHSQAVLYLGGAVTLDGVDRRGGRRKESGEREERREMILATSQTAVLPSEVSVS